MTVLTQKGQRRISDWRLNLNNSPLTRVNPQSTSDKTNGCSTKNHCEMMERKERELSTGGPLFLPRAIPSSSEKKQQPREVLFYSWKTHHQKNNRKKNNVSCRHRLLTHGWLHVAFYTPKHDVCMFLTSHFSLAQFFLCVSLKTSKVTNSFHLLRKHHVDISRCLLR
jgi:hypothetical protein